MTEESKRPLNYRTTMSEHDRFERNGWIGLTITLIVCAVVALTVLSLHR